jgi:hypothetical protein
MKNLVPHIKYPKALFIVLLAILLLGITGTTFAQGGHGPVFSLATPTLGKGELSFDALVMSARQGKNAWMIRQNWHYGLTQDIQLNLSVPTPLRQISQPPHGRLGTLMGTYGDLEASGLFRFFKNYYPGGGKRFESTLLLSGTVPTEKRRRGIRVGPSINGAVVTGYASRTVYGWLGSGYQYYGKSDGDQLGDITYLTAVFGYRPPFFQHDYPKPDWRIFIESVTEWVGSEYLDGQKRVSSEGRRTLIGPTVLGLYGKWGISGGIMFPVYSDFTGNSNAEDYRLSMILSYWF